MTTKPARPALQAQWSVRSHISTFLHCLHLLDLDLLDDWPVVTQQTFNPKASQQARVKAIEWSLYRLFELYDAAETQDKLRHLFPPATTLQSMNLRAGLYRCLTDLKRNGILGKDLLLRKTMLDECKGDMFERIITSLATLTLKKVTCRTLDSFLPQDETLSENELLALIIAHRSSLQTCTGKRRELHLHSIQTLHNINSQLKHAENRFGELRKRHLSIDDVLKQQMQHLVYTNWVGEQAWASLLLYGVHSRLAVSNSSLTTTHVPQVPYPALQPIIERHQARLVEWTIAMKECMTNDVSEDVRTEQTHHSVDHKPTLHFGAHQSISLNEAAKIQWHTPCMHPQYQKVIDAMEVELSKAPKVVTVRNSPEPNSKLGPSNVNGSGKGSSEPTRKHVREASLEVSATQPSPISSIADEDDNLPNNMTRLTMTDEVRMSLAADSETHISERRPTASNETSFGEVSQWPTSPSNEWLSLVDRTRASLAGCDDRRKSFPYDHIHEGLSPAEGTPMRHVPPLQIPPDRRTSLLERAQISMGMAGLTNHRRKRKTVQGDRSSQSFSVNQLGTPGKPSAGKESWSSNPSTPREKLFEENAEYASVFKSRPKLAQSPALSPDRSAVGFDSILGQDMEGLEFASDNSTD